MKTLYLIRHAKSSWDDPDIQDIDRPLNKRGKRDAPFMGKLLCKQNILPDIVVSSPARRAYSTAKLISDEIKFPRHKIEINKKLYEAGRNELLEVIHAAPDTNNSLMMFGHNPGLTYLSNFISSSMIENVPTCGIVCLTYSGTWEGIGENCCDFKFFEFPKKYF